MHKECIMTFNHISHTGPAHPVRPSPSSSRRSGPAVPTPVAVWRWTLLRCQSGGGPSSAASFSRTVALVAVSPRIQILNQFLTFLHDTCSGGSYFTEAIGRQLCHRSHFVGSYSVESTSVTVSLFTVFSRPGQSQGLIYKHLCN